MIAPLRKLLFGLLAGLVLASCSGSGEVRGPVVLAPSSMTNVMEELADVWAAKGHPRPVLSLAGTPALARQIEAGAPADIVISADREWMDWLEERHLVRADTAAVIANNGLVLAAMEGASQAASAEQALRNLGDGRLAMGDPESVPAGRYAKRALEEMGLWDEIASQVVPAENVRAALALVERGEAQLGVVYTSDISASNAALQVGVFDVSTGGLIAYPAAVVTGSRHGDAPAFLTFLTSEEAKDIFARHGFVDMRRLHHAD